ncbi:hypothetical protein CROQUDRAFT_37511 [Cronartium quercuum f. sp. fusiforme G11]|uniref:Essential protein Yae1 N-terminal domain-containing protein n=1 Tax=Cronartium quercuum f. sp. fusiforme G11 TaxID=708437 RepID=A0A9P6NPF0_9BASI|nr:hypothetical protein CROQUDRAFT_37511 [Cronartium quercuum f. sp. fusiforme G11]
MDSIDPLNHLEETFFQNGFKVGEHEGERLGHLDGFELGLRSGFKIWEELGFYLAHLKLMSFQLQTMNEERRALRLESKLRGFVKLIESFPTENKYTVTTDLHSEAPYENQAQPENDMVTLLNVIRSRYKICCTIVGMKPRIQAVSPLSM